MAAQFAGDDRPVVYEGIAQSGFGQPIGNVRDAPQDLVANSKDSLQLVSTRLGGTFPPGLSIGSVAWLEPGSTGIFQTGEVALDPRLLSLHEVAVLVPLNLSRWTTMLFDPRAIVLFLSNALLLSLSSMVNSALSSTPVYLLLLGPMLVLPVLYLRHNSYFICVLLTGLWVDASISLVWVLYFRVSRCGRRSLRCAHSFSCRA